MIRNAWFALLVALLIPGAGGAAEPEPAAPGEGNSVDLPLTGTRLRSADRMSAAPVVVIGREQLEASPGGTVGRFLQSLPSQGNATNLQMIDGGDGTTRVNLRSLGESRTLVLLDGRRLPGGGRSNGGAVDLDTIPIAAVDRIEILGAGGAAIYGQDAVAGVINVITRRSAGTGELSALTGASARGDGSTYDLSMTTGASGERGRFLLSAGFLEQRAVARTDRSWSERVYGLNYRTGALRYSGSSATPAGAFDIDTLGCGGTPTPACQALIDNLVGVGTQWFLAVDPSSPLGVHVFTPADMYDFNRSYDLISPARRYSLFTSGEANLGSGTRAFFEALYAGRQPSQRRAPEPLFTINSGATVSAQSYYNPYGVDLTDVRRRLVELGDRGIRERYDTFHAAAGLAGALPDLGVLPAGWTWEASFDFGRTNGTATSSGLVRNSRIAAALGPSFLDATDGVVKCGAPGSVIADCVPLNLLGGPGTITPAQAAWIGFQGTDRYVNQVAALHLDAGGELFRLGERPAAVAVGYERRRTSGETRPDAVAAAGDSSAGVVQPVSGGYYADELHAELGLPLASGRPLIDDLQASVAGRFYRYDSFGSGGSYQLGLRWRPVRDVTLRGTRSTALHAPSVDQLYRGTADAFLFAPDPCAAPVPGSPTDLICQSQGVPAGGNGSFQTIQRAVVGGNPRLDAETADIYTLGVVFEPTGLPGLSVSLDYYHLALARSVDSLGAGFILDSCYAGGASQYCDRVHRNVSGAIDYVDDRYTNAGRTVTGGIDLSARWDVPSSIGRFQLAADGTWLQRYDRTDATGNTIAHAGNYDQLLAMPRLKANAAVTWTRHALRAGLALRWVGSYEECATTAGLSSTTGLCSPGINDPVPATRLSHTIGSWSSWDTFAGYELPSSLGKTTIMVGVSNLFDQNPPVTYNLTNSAADPSTYDFTGRYFFARLGQAF